MRWDTRGERDRGRKKGKRVEERKRDIEKRKGIVGLGEKEKEWERVREKESRGGRIFRVIGLKKDFSNIVMWYLLSRVSAG